MADRTEMTEQETKMEIALYEVIDKREKPGSNPVYSTISTATRNAENIYTEATATATASSKKKISQSNISHESRRFACSLVMIGAVATITLICLVVLFVEVAKLKSQTASINPSQQIADISATLRQLQQINGTLSQQTA